MALVTVQRASSPTRTPSASDEVDEGAEGSTQGKRQYKSQRSLKKLMNTVNTIRFVNRLSKLLVERLNYRFSESYFTIKGAALILPKSDKLPQPKKRTKAKPSAQVTIIQTHLQQMFHEVRPDDTIQVAIKLETSTPLARYLATVVSDGETGRQEGLIIGFHCSEDTAHIGLVVPIYRSTEISLDGDGGFRVKAVERPHIFKPISIQAMWSAIMSLNKVCATAQQNNQTAGGANHQFLSFYTDKVTSDQTLINEWEMLDDLMVSREESSGTIQDEDMDSLEKQIRKGLRELVAGCDLENVTSYMMRMELEKRLSRPLKEYRSFIDQELMLLIRQLDVPSDIFDFLYLGSEWNACNLPELQTNGVGYILNVTREIDNFFPGQFKYMNVRLFDDEESDLMKHWESTHRFICKARDNNSKILVHCKMGVSRSASTVIAFAMKEYGWSLEQAIEHVHDRRAVIKPNDSFMQQLRTYEGILNAIRNRWNPMFVNEGGDKQDGRRRELDVDDFAGNREATTKAMLTSESEDSSDSDCSTSSCTTSYSLEEDSDDQNLSTDDGRVIGLHYTKLNEETTTSTSSSLDVQSDVQTLSRLSQDAVRGLHATGNTTSDGLPTATDQQTDGSDDTSVCYGVVRKTKEMIAGGLTQTSAASTATEDQTAVSLTSGIVRKVLGEIVQKSQTDLTRSASLRMARRREGTDADTMHRSASMRVKRTSADPSIPSNRASSTGASRRAFSQIETSSSPQIDPQSPDLRQSSEVKFSIGGSNIGSSSSSSVEDVLERVASSNATAFDPAVAHPCRPKEQQLDKSKVLPADCILRVSSKRHLHTPGSAADLARHSTPVPVRDLVGAFEDIGTMRPHLSRPLTIHVDSFSSDPFTQQAAKTAGASPLKRSQSLQVMTPPAVEGKSKANHQFHIKKVGASAASHLKPYWKIKLDTAKQLIHSFSSASVSSRNTS